MIALRFLAISVLNKYYECHNINIMGCNSSSNIQASDHIHICYIQEAVIVSKFSNIVCVSNQGVRIVSLHWLCRLHGTCTGSHNVLHHFCLEFSLLTVHFISLTSPLWNTKNIIFSFFFYRQAAEELMTWLKMCQINVQIVVSWKDFQSSQRV